MEVQGATLHDHVLVVLDNNSRAQRKQLIHILEGVYLPEGYFVQLRVGLALGDELFVRVEPFTPLFDHPIHKGRDRELLIEVLDESFDLRL